jgi:hypothetical protein
MSSPQAVPPDASYTDWLTDPDGAGEVIDDALAGMWQTAGWVGGVLAAVAVGLKFARFIPVWGPMINSLGEMALSHIRPPAVEKAKAKAETLESTAWAMINALEAAPKTPEVQALKKKITDMAPPQFQAIFREWKNSREALEAKS